MYHSTLHYRDRAGVERNVPQSCCRTDEYDGGLEVFLGGWYRYGKMD